MHDTQLALFPPDGKVEAKSIHVRRSTFRGGLAEAIHRWFRLTPSFGPGLVREALAEMATVPGSVVLDPFSGAGTTLIEAKLEGHTAVGFEINPLLHFVCRACLQWDLSEDNLRSRLTLIKDHFDDHAARVAHCSVADLGITLPPIHNVYRWWRCDVLKDLLVLLTAVRSTCIEDTYRDFFELALAGVLVPDLTNVTLGRLQLHFINRETDQIKVWDTFYLHAKQMITDLAAVREHKASGLSGRVFHTDATNPIIPADFPVVDRVVTSPPYPNRYSYVWNTRPYLYLFGFFDNASQAGKLDLATIGGTWGTATSILAKGTLKPQSSVIDRVVTPVVSLIRAHDNLMANYLMKYFNLLELQITAQHRLLSNDAKMAYVVGCSTLKGVYVEVDVLLGEIFEGLDLGYKVSKIQRFRRRNSGKDLHESIIYVERTA